MLNILANIFLSLSSHTQKKCEEGRVSKIQLNSEYSHQLLSVLLVRFMGTGRASVCLDEGGEGKIVQGGVAAPLSEYIHYICI